MAYPTFELADLVAFSGRDELEYDETFVGTAIKQATLLFKIGTCLADLPDDAVAVELAENAILHMADSIVLAQPFQKVKSNPFSSESIGSYSYSKAAKVVADGKTTGIMWFDLAVQMMSVCETHDGISMGGGIEVLEFDGVFIQGSRANNSRFMSPGDLEAHTLFLYDPNVRRHL